MSLTPHDFEYSYKLDESYSQQNRLYGLEFKTKNATPKEIFHLDNTRSTVEAATTEYAGTCGVTSYGLSDLTVPTDDIRLINEYRALSTSALVQRALTEIRNEAFINDEPNERCVELEFLTDPKVNDLDKSMQTKIKEVFTEVYDLLDFGRNCNKYFMDWYIDSRIVFHKIIDETRPKKGILGLNQIDPTSINYVRMIPRRDSKGIIDQTKIREFFVYQSPYNMQSSSAKGFGNLNSDSDEISTFSPFNYYGERLDNLEISKDVITYIDSGVIDKKSGRILGELYKVINPYNKLKLIEDSMLIFRITRAPSRLVIYVDVGGLNTNKAEAKMHQAKNSMQTKTAFNSKTGTLVDHKHIMAITENYYITRTGEGRASEITQLEGGNFDGVLEETQYYKDDVLHALNVPLGRLDEERSKPMIFAAGMSEIERDEYKFKRFINRKRKKFMELFDDMMRTQSLLTGVIDNENDWNEIRSLYYFKYAEDNVFVEAKMSEQLQRSANNVRALLESNQAGLISKRYIARKALGLTDEEIEEEIEQIKKERELEPKENIEVDNNEN